MTLSLNCETLKFVHPALFHPKALEAFRGFPKDVRHWLGEAVLDLQYGEALAMPLSRPMPAVGPGVSELRVRDKSGIYRAFYVVKVKKGILVFHAFQKKTRKTPRHELLLASRRLREMLL